MKQCRACGELKPITEYHKHSGTKDKLRNECKNCRRERDRVWRKTPKGKESKRKSDIKQRAKGNIAKAGRKYLLKQYGLTLFDYEQMYKNQKGKCALCGKFEKSKHTFNLSVDHCHKTGKVRGLLCRTCNIMLGVADDNTNFLKKAIQYLKNRQRLKPKGERIA